MADEENEVKQISDKDENVMEDSSKAEVLDKMDVKEDLPEVKSDDKEESQTNDEKAEDKIEDEEDEDDDGEDEDDDDDDEERETLPPGLLEQPLEVEGKRQKRKVERLSATMMRAPVEKPQIEIEEGLGTKLGDIPYVTHYLNITKSSDLKSLHKLLFLRAEKLHEIKKNIRKFSGTTEAKDSKEREKRLAIANKMSLPELKNICLWFGLRQTGTKAELTERTMTYLEKPEDQGVEIKKKRSKPKPAKKKGTKRKRKTKNTDKDDKPKKKAKKSKNADSEMKEKQDEDNEEDDEAEDDIEGDEDSEEDKDAVEEDSEEEAPKKKKPKLEVKKKEKEKKTPQKTVKENGKKEKASPKKEKPSPKKKATPPTKVKSPKKETKKKAAPKKETPELSDSLSDDSDDSEEEPLVATIKPPSDDEIKKVVKTILDGADLETVTMKTVVKQVYAKYPKFDLSDRKNFIKSTVREVIS